MASHHHQQQQQRQQIPTAPGCQILGAVTPAQASVLSVPAQRFVATLHRAFNPARLALLARREARQAEIDGGKLPDFLPETRAVREDPSWRGAPPAPGLADRRVEITGPVDAKMVINALNSGATQYMADFEGASMGLLLLLVVVVVVALVLGCFRCVCHALLCVLTVLFSVPHSSPPTLRNNNARCRPAASNPRRLQLADVGQQPQRPGEQGGGRFERRAACAVPVCEGGREGVAAALGGVLRLPTSTKHPPTNNTNNTKQQNTNNRSTCATRCCARSPTRRQVAAPAAAAACTASSRRRSSRRCSCARAAGTWRR